MQLAEEPVEFQTISRLKGYYSPHVYRLFRPFN